MQVLVLQRPLEHPPGAKVSVRDQRGRAAAGLLETGRSVRHGGSAGSLAEAVVGSLLVQEPLKVELGVVVERRKRHRRTRDGVRDRLRGGC